MLHTKKENSKFILICLLLLLSGLSALIYINRVYADDNSSNEIVEKDGIIINNTSFEMTVLSVGQGDSILVNCDGHYMLVDGGKAYASKILYTVLKKQGVYHLDYIVNTHPDSDHVGGLPGALEYASVDKVYASNSIDSEEYINFVDAVKKQEKEIEFLKTEDSFNLGSSNVYVLLANHAEGNNSSIVLKIVYGNTSFLLMGDAEYEIEEYFLRNKTDISCDVIKISHHGSQDSSSYSFLKKASPKYACISVGENEYGHPSDYVLENLRKLGIETYRTDQDGDIKFVSDGATVTVQTNKDW